MFQTHRTRFKTKVFREYVVAGMRQGNKLAVRLQSQRVPAGFTDSELVTVRRRGGGWSHPPAGTDPSAASVLITALLLATFEPRQEAPWAAPRYGFVVNPATASPLRRCCQGDLGSPRVTPTSSGPEGPCLRAPSASTTDRRLPQQESVFSGLEAGSPGSACHRGSPFGGPSPRPSPPRPHVLVPVSVLAAPLAEDAGHTGSGPAHGCPSLPNHRFKSLFSGVRGQGTHIQIQGTELGPTRSPSTPPTPAATGKAVRPGESDSHPCISAERTRAPGASRGLRPHRPRRRPQCSPPGVLLRPPSPLAGGVPFILLCSFPGPSRPDRLQAAVWQDRQR